MRGPDFIIAGGHKCATTTLHALLSEHPEVEMSLVKEPHYLARSSLRNRLHRGVWSGPDYERLWRGSARVRGEASVLYLSFADDVIKSIRRECDSPPKIVLSLRDPIERALSSYIDSRLTNPREDAPSFEAAVARELRFPPGDVSGEELPTMRHLALGFYSLGVDRFMSEFGEDNVHVILFEEFRDRPSTTWDGLQRSLEIARVSLPEVPRMNAGGREWRGGISSILARSQASVHARRALRRVAPRAHARLRHRALNQLTEPAAAMAPGTRRMLSEYYADEIRQLSELLGRDLGCWTPRHG